MHADARNDLAAQQSRLVEALTTGAHPPAGFDAVQLETAAKALGAKRARCAAKAWPRLAESLGDRFGKLFAAYASESSLPTGAEPRNDGRAFGRWLARREFLPEAGRIELAVGAASRGFPLRVTILRRPLRIVVLWRFAQRVRVLGMPAAS